MPGPLTQVMASRSSSPPSEQLEEEEVEDVSLSDLPLIFTEPDQSQSSNLDTAAKIMQAVEEFDFGSSMRGSSFSAETQMCAADELFFEGQILPLRLSISSDKPNPRLSISELMDRQCSIQGIKGIISSDCSSSSTRISPNSSRSNSNNSSSSTATTNTSIANTNKPRLVPVRNQFYTHPSPKPQIQVSNGARLEKLDSRRSQKSSSIWDFFRLGLVRTPDQDLNKVIIRSNSARVNSTRISVSRNSSVSSNTSTNINNNNSSSSAANVATISDGDKNNGNTSSTAALINSENLRQKNRHRFFINSCKCSFEAVASNAVVPKSNVVMEREATHEKKADKVAADVIKMKMMKKKKKLKSGSKKKQQKQDMSHHRTYEWLKGL